MIAYHFDRLETLTENIRLSLIPIDSHNETIQLYGLNEVSSWGRFCYKHLINPFDTDFQTMNSLQIDLNSEVIRKQFFPDKPSRLKSLFAVRNVSDFALWKEFFDIGPHSAIYKVEYDPSICIELDARFLKGGIDCNTYSLIDFLKMYWSGAVSNSPLPEILIPLPVVIGRRLSPEEIIF